MAGEAPWVPVEEQIERLRPPTVFAGDPLRETAIRLALEEHRPIRTTNGEDQCDCDRLWRQHRQHREHQAKAIEARLCEMGY